MIIYFFPYFRVSLNLHTLQLFEGIDWEINSYLPSVYLEQESRCKPFVDAGY